MNRNDYNLLRSICYDSTRRPYNKPKPAPITQIVTVVPPAPQDRIIPVKDMVEGEIGKVVEQANERYIGTFVLRTERGLITLGAAHIHWSDVTNMPEQFKVRILPKGTQITLTV